MTLWDFSTRQPLTELPESCNRVAFSPDGQTLIAGSYNAINFWDIDTAAKLRSVAQKGSTISLAVSLKGNKLAASTHLTLKVFDLSDLGRFVTLTGFEPRIWTSAFSPDGNLLAAGSSDQTIRIWNVSSWGASNAPIQVLRGHGSEVHALAFAPDKRLLASGDYRGGILLWDLDFQPFRPVLSHVAVNYLTAQPIFSRDGQVMAAVSRANEVSLWDARTLQRLQVCSGAVIPLAISPEQQTFMALGTNAQFQQWDLENGHLLRAKEFVRPQNPFTAALSADRKLLAVGYLDGSFGIWNSATEEKLWQRTEEKGAIRELAFSPDGRWLATAIQDGTAKVWDLRARKHVATLAGHTEGVFSVAFSPDGKTIATGSIDDTARLWDARTGKPLAVFDGHKQGVFRVAFSPDGQTLATVSDDRTARLWSLRTGRELARLNHSASAVLAAFTPDGEALVVGYQTGALYFWRAPSLAQIDAMEPAKSATE